LSSKVSIGEAFRGRLFGDRFSLTKAFRDRVKGDCHFSVDTTPIFH